MELITQPELSVAKKTELPTTPQEALELVFKEYAPNTRRAYSRVFKDFQVWACIEKVEDLAKLNSMKMLEYKTFLKSQGKAASSINQTMSGLKKICKFLSEFGYISANPFKSSIIRNEKTSGISNKGALRVAQLSAMMEANQSEVYDERVSEIVRVRNGLILKFLYLTAARRSEAANLQWVNIRQDGPYFVAILEETKSRVPQPLKLRQELYNELQDWKQLLEEHHIESPWIFPSFSFRTFGKKMTGKGINDVIQRLGKIVGLDISAHYLRHTAITLALELGEPLQKVQSYARHVSANTTIRYYHDQDLLKKNPTDRLPMI
ncbi:MAG: site-specific integrase [SAR324 cluster bacterium]|nr:site-specific integrase [SAR324 cluster bacterium]